MDEQFIRDRITELRIKKGVSEYKMSLDLGHSRSYIQSIVCGRILPSLKEFLYICSYFEVEPKDFFDIEVKQPALVQKAIEGIKNLDDADLLALISIINRFNN